MVASKQVPAPPPTTRAHDQRSDMIRCAQIGGQVLPNLCTPSGDNLDSVKPFVRAWNAADLADDSSASTAVANPAGPSQVLLSLHYVHTSVAEAKRFLEVILLTLAFTSS